MREQLMLLACLTLLGCSEKNAIAPVVHSEVERQSLDTHWTMIQPGGDTGCSRGTPFHFWTKRGDSDNLLVYFLGGGACWNAKSCNKDFPYFDDQPDTPPYYTGGIFDLHNPENPFLDWNIVFIPYCTGDTHWGNNVHTYPQSGLYREVEIQHKGFNNAMSAVKWTFDHFETPAKIFLAGDSAGGYGSVMFAPHLMEHYKNSSFVHFIDSAAGVSTPEFIEHILTTWNVTPNIHPSQREVIDLAERSPRSLTTALCFKKMAEQYPEHQFAWFNTVEDKTQKFFFESLGGAPEDWHPQMEATVDDLERSLFNFSSVTAFGELHVVLLRNEFYTYKAGGVRVRDFVAQLAEGKKSASLHCVDCVKEQLHHATNPAATGEEKIVQPYQDPDFECKRQASFQCGPGSLFTVFHYFEGEDVYTDRDCTTPIDLSSELDEVAPGTNFCDWVNGGKQTGTSWDEMKYAIKDLRKDCERLFAVELVDAETALDQNDDIEERNRRLNDIHRRYLLRKRPVVIHLRRSEGLSGHYLVLIGFDKDGEKVYYADPNRGKIGIVSKESFIKEAWYRSPSNPADYNLAYWDGEWMGFYPTAPEDSSIHDNPYEKILDRYKIEKGLIVNGDDFGLSTPVNQGIQDAFERGILTSTSIQTPAEMANDALHYASASSNLAAGVHLTLSRPSWATIGPLTGSRRSWSLVDQSKLFPTSVFSVLFKSWNSQVEAELRAQIERVQKAGIEITHLDCHDAWCHFMDQRLDSIFLKLAQELDVPVRWLFPDGERLKDRGLLSAHILISPGTNQKLADYEKRKRSIISKLRSLKRYQIAELVLHPQTGEILNGQDFRVMDYQLAFDEDLQQVVAEENITLIDYSILKQIQQLLNGVPSP